LASNSQKSLDPYQDFNAKLLTVYGLEMGIVSSILQSKKAPVLLQSSLYNIGLWISIHLIRIRIRIQHFRLNTDPDPDPIRIEDFDDQKLEKIYS
jgi:hypothetical protein